MSLAPTSTLGYQVWRMLPEVYRSRDDAGHLALYLDACGVLLDRIHGTLDQRAADALPDTCQPWLLPYFADLLDVRLVSPHVAGQRKEVANAVEWRKRKGTNACVEQIAEQVGQVEVEIQEGWRRVVRSAEIGTPLLSGQALGQAEVPGLDNPLEAAKHPGLPAATVDFRLASRAVRADAETAVTKHTSFAGERVLWQQANVHGVPCFPGSYEDVSRRTVDMRTPDAIRGHFHAKRALLYTPPPTGFFHPDVPTMTWLRPSEDPDHEQLGPRTFSGSEDGPVETVTVWLTELLSEIEHEIVYADGRRDVRWTFAPRAGGGSSEPSTESERASQLVSVRGRVELDREPDDNERFAYHFERIIFRNTLYVARALLRLERVAASRVVSVRAPSSTAVVIGAKDSIFRYLRAARGITQLEYCTVVTAIVAERLHASDSILLGVLRADLSGTNRPSDACVRYSCVPSLAGVEDFSTLGDWSVYRPTLVTEPPVLYSSTFGAVGYGVLHEATSTRICFGSEDGGEMGAYHHRRDSLREDAVLTKLKDFLPVGIQPVFIRDSRLRHAPPG